MTTINPQKAALKAVLNVEVPDPAGGWQPLPGFTFGMPCHGADHEAFGKNFMDTMLRLYALAVRHEFQASSAEVQFAALCRLSWGDDHVEFGAYAPRAGITAFVKKSIGSKEGLAAMPKLLSTFDGKMVRKCAFPPDVWVPLAIVYTPSSGQVLFSNVNQLEDPGQFLNPSYCQSTSGFLNYIGAMILRHRAAPDTPMAFDNVEFLLGKGMDPFIRWINQLVASGTPFDSDRIFVKTADPERYDYKYGS